MSKFFIITLFILLPFFLGCGKNNDDPDVITSGNVITYGTGGNITTWYPAWGENRKKSELIVDSLEDKSTLTWYWDVKYEIVMCKGVIKKGVPYSGWFVISDGDGKAVLRPTYLVSYFTQPPVSEFKEGRIVNSKNLRFPIALVRKLDGVPVPLQK